MSEYTEVQPSGKTVSSTAAMQLFVEQQTSAMLVAQKAAQKAVKKKNSKVR
ncbi:MAG: hypothetical protein GY737_05445 [Desulfobacteraceae bacterium]|nr:hypothetical protein [Desulfobacteraceae bacterium]